MSKKIQCEECNNAEYGEDLYDYNGEILCRYCIMERVVCGRVPCEYFGTCNDTSKKTKKCSCNKKDQRIAELEKENAELKAKLQEAKQKLEEME